MSLFIAAQAFPLPVDFAAAKIAVFAASAVASVAGVAVLWIAPPADQVIATTGAVDERPR
jgi:NhaA family Na+:H+ antiporter